MESVKPREYLGLEKFSHVPDGVVAATATVPGNLCERCSTVDITDFFIDPVASNEDLRFDEQYRLNDLYNVFSSAATCDFCSLVVNAIRNRLPDLCPDSPRHGLVTVRGAEPLQIYIVKQWSGSYFVDGEKRHASCIAVYSNADHLHGVREANRDRGYIRLLANDAHLLGQLPLYHGRLVGNHISPRLLWQWIEACSTRHQECSDLRSQWGLFDLVRPRSLYLVNCETMCLSKKTVWEYQKHIALSYVWGASHGLQLKKANMAELFRPGALKTHWESIPKLIQDAIELVRDLNQYCDAGYKGRNTTWSFITLWVDQLCIVQDDPVARSIQIEQMANIYQRALATIFAADADDCSQPLLRTNVDDDQHRAHIQDVKNINGLRLVAALPSVAQSIRDSNWNTRGWALQESDLSHSAIIFTKSQVVFRCAVELLPEDFAAENKVESGIEEIEDHSTTTKPPAKSRSKSKVRIKYDDMCQHVEMVDRRDAANGSIWPLSFGRYNDLVERYTSRDLTKKVDILNAFKGISQIQRALCSWDMSNGLPLDVIDLALLWRPVRGTLIRRFSKDQQAQRSKNSYGEEKIDIPTYSWAAWQGPVTYEPLPLRIRSLVHRFHGNFARKKFHIPRWSQREGDGDGLQLQSPFPFAPQDRSGYQNAMQGLTWARPQLQNVLFSMHAASTPAFKAKDGLCMLEFEAKCVVFRLSEDIGRLRNVREGPAHDINRDELYLLDKQSRPVGSVWAVPALDEYKGKEVEVICLSQTAQPVSGDLVSWKIELPEEMFVWSHTNVMLIKRVASGCVERLTIGKVREDSCKEGKVQSIRLI